MSNPFDEADDDTSGEILMGFLCPICREDLKSVEFLTEHFENAHAEEQDALKSVFKDIFAKAKKKILLNFDDTLDITRNLEKSSIGGASGTSASSAESTTNNTTNSTSNARTRANVYNFITRQEVGVDRGHFDYFQSVRSPRLERYANETNMLIIRLHDLLADMPIDPVQRKHHEKNTVPWLDGSSVKLCPNCAKKFSITRRQHHCRLCGCIMCNDCSKFLPIEFGLELASLNVSQSESIDRLKAEALSNPQESGLRSCEHCLRLLETRKDMQDTRACSPLITEIYGEIQKSKKAVMPDIEMYLKIIASLYEGESIFTLADASALRGKIGQVAESIDNRSKRILTIPSQPGSREESLKKAVRISCIQLIKDKMLSLPPLPAEAEIRKIQERKHLEAEQRAEMERRMAQEAYERYGLAGASDKHRSAMDFSSSQLPAEDHDDPLLEQINIIKGYIKQARKDMSFDVIETLETNLRELQFEYQQRQRDLSRKADASDDRV